MRRRQYPSERYAHYHADGRREGARSQLDDARRRVMQAEKAQAAARNLSSQPPNDNSDVKDTQQKTDAAQTSPLSALLDGIDSERILLLLLAALLYTEQSDDMTWLALLYTAL